MAAEEYAIHVDGLTREEWEGAVRRDRYAVLASQPSEYIQTLERTLLASWSVWVSDVESYCNVCGMEPPHETTCIVPALLEKYPEP